MGVGNANSGPLRFRCALRDLIRCGGSTSGLLARRRIHQPAGNVRRRISFADGTTASVYRETVIDGTPPAKPAVLVVGFRLRRIRSDRAHALFRRESELNTIFFAGFPGLISKLWLGHDQNGLYRGLYQWDDPDLAVSYARALWWVLAVVSEPGTIHYKVLPGVWLDRLLTTPALVDAEGASNDRWWLPVATEAPASPPATTPRDCSPSRRDPQALQPRR